MKRTRDQHGLSALELLEEAVHVLRGAPAAVLATYAVGSFPFILGLLYFWGDMSRSAFAVQHVAGASLAMAGLYAWMKFWHVLFANRVRALLSGDRPVRLTAGRCLRILVAQTALQPLVFFVLPIALLLTLPFGWVYAFFQNLSVIGGDDERSLGTLCSRAARQAALWPRQNHLVLLFTGAFGFFVFINWATTVLVLPSLARTLFGFESLFSRSGLSMVNTTFLAITLGLTYLCVAPVLKVVYVLRCFYGDSLGSGEDLRAELKRLRSTAVLIMGMVLAGAQAWAASDRQTEGQPIQTVTAQEPSFTPVELDEAIRKTLSERKYGWRLPRDETTGIDREKGPVGRFLELVRVWIKDVLEKFGEWLRKLFRGRAREGSGGWGWMTSVHLLVYAAIAAVSAMLAIVLYRCWRHVREVPAIAQPLPALPDLKDETVGAEQLPEGDWITLASELMGRGELRLAMRALYLGSLAHLAGRNLVTLARFKSNQDYMRELRRRAHSTPAVLEAFSQNVVALERVWYGKHDVQSASVTEFAGNVERIRSAR